MKYFKRFYRVSAPRFLFILGVCGNIGISHASFDSDFIHKYTELNLGNYGHDNYTFPNSNDQVNAFNRSVNIDIPIGESYHVNASFSTQMSLKYGSNFWEWTDVNNVISAKPRSNFFSAGIGFNLGFGKLIAPSDNPYGLWVYESEKGRIIRFYDNFNGELPVTNVFYSHDSSKLRLKVSGGTSVTLEFTDGKIHEFRQQEGSWEIYKLSDQFGNFQQFTYDYPNNQVTTSDNHGRVQRILFKPDSSGYFPRLIDKVSVANFGGGFIDHVFNYTNQLVYTPAKDNDPTTPQSRAYPTLTSVTNPDGELVKFDYFGGTASKNGMIKNYTNRFGGRIRYNFDDIELPLVQNPVNLNQSIDHFASTGVGLVLRRTVDDVAGKILGNWTFSAQWKDGTRNPAPSLSQPSTLNTVMSRPDGFTENRYFKTPIQDVAVTTPEVFTVDKSEYGFAGHVIDSRETTTSDITSTLGTHTLSRVLTNYSCTNCLDPFPQHVSKAKTDEGIYTIRTIYSGFNWAGRPASVSYYADESLERSINYEQSTNKPAVSSLWITSSPNKTTISEGSFTKITEHCLNSLGKITRQRNLRGSTQGSNDFVREAVYDAPGNVVEIKYFGGDSQAVASGELCTLTLPTAQYRKYNNYSYGSVANEGFLTSAGAIALETKSNTIDLHTGLPISRQLSDGLLKTYTYDSNLRRTQRLLPAGTGGHVTTAFVGRSGTTYATNTISDVSNVDFTVLEQTVDKYDSFGRVIETKKLGPAGWAVTSKVYDAMGYVTSETDGSGRVTQYLNRDYKGRVGIKRPNEGAVHDVTYTYSGDIISTRKVSIAKDLTTNPPTEEFRTTTDTRDIFGRTISSVISDQDGTVQTTTKNFDLNGKWITKFEGGVNTTNPYQYDALGFPIVNAYGSNLSYDALGNKLEDYSRYGDKIDLVYDSVGRLISKSVGGINYIDYVYGTTNNPGEYNKGKLISASRKNLVVKDFLRTLVVTDSFEYKGLGGRLSKRTTSINDPSGLGNIMSSASTVSYDDNLRAISITSPSCVGSAVFPCPSQSAPQTQTYDYSYGRLLNVTNDGTPVMSDIQYNSAGNVISYKLANGLDNEIHHSENISEPSQLIIKKEGSIIWDSGVASNDGAGNIHHYGSNQEISDDFYDQPNYTPQSTNYLVAPPNESLVVDALGMVTSAMVPCEGNYPPCENVNIYDFNNNIIWQRHRPFGWPESPLNLKTPSELILSDALGRKSTTIVGDTAYTLNNHRNVTTFDRNYNYWSISKVFLGDSAHPIYLSEPYSPYYYTHYNFANAISSEGFSDDGGEFTPNKSY